jgi:hypothetical protein
LTVGRSGGLKQFERMRHWVFGAVTAGVFGGALGCSSDPVSSDEASATGGRSSTPPSRGGAPSSAGGADSGPGEVLRVPVSADEPSFVNLDEPAVTEEESPGESTEWELSFQGWNVTTNGGVSGPGKSWSFGPISYYYLEFPEDPIDAPLEVVDHPGGAFQNWYVYADDHGLYSRYHVYGVRTPRGLFKLQILGYRGEVEGTPVSALYRLRWAEVGEDGEGELQELSNLDATANDDATNPDEPSTCLVLATGEQLRLTPEEALDSKEWDLCFRRDAISVNGGAGGTGEVEAVDLDAAEMAAEDEDEESVIARTPTTELERLESTDYARLTAPGVEYLPDGVVSGFTGRWYEAGDPPLPSLDAWLVEGAEGLSSFLVAFDGFEDAGENGPGTVLLRIVRTDR